MAYRIQSTQTKYYLISDDQDTEGNVVKTVPDNEHNDSTTVLKIYPPLQGRPDIRSVESARVPGLFVGYKDTDNGLFLSWTREPVQWFFAPTPVGGDYNISVLGQDRYWFDKFSVGILRRIALKSGSEVQERENYFTITEA